MNSNAPPTNPLCQAEQSCLIVIDVQERLAKAIPGKVLGRLVRNVQILVQAAQTLSIPIIVSEQYPSGLGKTLPDIERLLPSDAVRVEKTCFSLARAEEAVKALEETRRKQCVIAGMEAHVCILQSAFELRAAGYQAFVAADATCSRLREGYENALSRLLCGGVPTVETESTLFEWLRDASHPQFKALQALVK